MTVSRGQPTALMMAGWKGKIMRYVYTEKAEKRAKELGLEERKAGSVAMLGHEPLQCGVIAEAWKKKGYIIAV